MVIDYPQFVLSKGFLKFKVQEYDNDTDVTRYRSVSFCQFCSFCHQWYWLHDVGIYQAQDGFDLTQKAAIANVTDQYAGQTNIYVHHAKIYQKQKGQGGKQTATIATICAECTSSK